MRLLSLDYDPVYGDDDTTIRAGFASDESAFDFDVVIWDPEATFKTYLPIYPSLHMGLPLFSDDDSVQLTRNVARRHAEFSEFVKSGRTLIIFVRPPQECYIGTGVKTYSGTGRSRVATRHLESFDLMQAVPLDDCTFSRGAGSRIEYVGGGPTVELLKKYKKRIRYSAVISQSEAQPVARVAGTGRVIGAVYRHVESGGLIIFLPTVDLTADFDEKFTADPDNGAEGDIAEFDSADENATDGDEEDDDDDDEPSIWSNLAPDFQVDLLAAVQKLGNVRLVARPTWMQGFATNEQLDMRSRLSTQRMKVEEARAELAKMELAREAIDTKDQLFLGTGRALELEVRSVLELLGGNVTNPEPGRDDWRVEFPEGSAVVEVKGVSKSAAEKHAAQLEKWVAGAYEDTGVMPKGILVVNTWKDTPLHLRREVDFPAQMIPYSTSRGHCLISGLQLFVLRAQVESGEITRDAACASIMNAAGVLHGFTDWRAILRDVKAVIG